MIKISYYFGDPEKETAKKLASRLDRFVNVLNEQHVADARAAGLHIDEIGIQKLAYLGASDNFVTALLVTAPLDDHLVINRKYREIQRIQASGGTMELLPSTEQEQQAQQSRMFS